jgi:tetratricopeptide (TPR) repeat protein
LAYAALSRTAEANERIDIMLQAAQHALRLDPRSQLRWFDIAYAYYVSHDYDRAREPTARVIELAPDDAFYRTFEANNTLSFDGDFAAYWARLHAIKPDNNDDRALLMLNLAEQSDAQADEALRFFATMPQWVPSDIGGDMPRDVAQAWLYEKKGDQDAARPHWQRAIAPLEERRRDAPNSVDTALKLAEAYAATGQPDGARRLVNQVLSAPEYRDPSQRGLIAVGLASALIKLGEPSKAIDQLASALERPSDLSPQLLSLERRLQSLHRDPRFAALAHIDTVSGNTLPGG